MRIATSNVIAAISVLSSWGAFHTRDVVDDHSFATRSSEASFEKSFLTEHLTSKSPPIATSSDGAGSGEAGIGSDNATQVELLGDVDRGDNEQEP
jgi:hypothetical protein